MNLTGVLLVGAGGALGSMARYATAFFVDRKLNAVFPYGTLAVNILGSFVLGMLLGLLARKTGSDATAWKLFLGTGFCGGFTTFSAFAVENSSLITQKLPATSLLYIALSVTVGLAAAWAGLTLGRNIS